MAITWTLRRYRDGDEQSILELLNTAYGGWGSSEYWQWKYERNPAGFPIIWVAERGASIIGHYAAMPVAMKLGNSYIAGSSAADAATHPDYRGQGVFSSLANRISQDAAENRIPITYGLADTDLGPTYRRYEHMGHICFMIPMIRVLNWKPFAARYIPNKALVSLVALALRNVSRSRSRMGPFVIEIKSRFDEGIDLFWEEVSRNFKIIVRRDQKYLNWRYTENPDREYTIHTAVKNGRILGYCVLAERQWQNLRMGLIVDVLGFHNSRDVVSSLVHSAVTSFEQHHFDGVACMLSEQHPYAPILGKAGFITLPRSTTHVALHAAINLPSSPIDEKRVYSQALALSQSPLLKEKSNWFMIHDIEYL